MLPFNPKNTSFNLHHAVLLARVAKLAYESEGVIRKTLLGDWGMDECRFISKAHTQLFVASHKQFILVSFRGTESNKLQDWLTDAKARFSQTPLGRVHRGFLAALNVVWPDLEKTLNKFRHTRQTVWFTGHSLGAALATLAVARYLEQNKRFNGLYTFGSPRVGDELFAHKFDRMFKTRTHRFTNNNDIVTRVPPRQLGYSHVGLSKHIDAFGRLHRDMNTWAKFLDSLAGMAERTLPRFLELRRTVTAGASDWVLDHDMGTYVKKIEALVMKPR